MNAINFNYYPENNVELTSGGVNFSHLKNSSAELEIAPAPPEDQSAPRKVGRPRKKIEGDIVKAEVISSTLDDYKETQNLIKQTIVEVDTLTSELKNELDTIRSSRTLRNKYTYMTDLSSNIGSLLGTKIQAIKEINNIIKTANDFDYKKQKDANAANLADSDQQIYALYNAFVNSPVSQGNRSLLGPDTAQMSIAGMNDNIVRVDPSSNLDIGYQNFRQNMSPEQKMMIMEDQVENVIVYDAATGNKYFEIVDRSGNPVIGLPKRDPMFLEDFTIDLRNRIARNINLNESMRVIVMNENKKFDEY